MKTAASPLSRPDRTWLKTSLLMWGVLAGIALLALLLPLYASALNLLSFLGFPLGFYMAAQGSLIGIAGLAFLFAHCQDRIEAKAARHEDPS